MCEGLPAETSAIRRQIARFQRELSKFEVRRSLDQRDAAAAARHLSTLAACNTSPLWQVAARMSRQWPASLLWAYQLRRAWHATVRS